MPLPGGRPIDTASWWFFVHCKAVVPGGERREAGAENRKESKWLLFPLPPLAFRLPSSFVSQGVDRIESRRLLGRIEAEKDPDRRRKHEREHDRRG